MNDMRSSESKTIEIDLSHMDLFQNELKGHALPDECGDSLWDNVLQQHSKRNPTSNGPSTTSQSIEGNSDEVQIKQHAHPPEQKINCG